MRAHIPGLVVAGLGAGFAFGLALLSGTLSAIALAVGLGILVRSLGVLPEAADPGLRWVARTLLRAGIVLVGFRLALGDLAAVGGFTLLTIVAVASATLCCIYGISRLLGLSRSLGLLTGAGYAICGATAVAAMREVIGADEEAPAFAIALVTIFGTLSIVALPLLANTAGLSPSAFGHWAGSAVHDIGQVVATAASGGEEALTVAVVVKLTRVLLLGPLLVLVGLWVRRSDSNTHTGTRPNAVPGFILLFIGAVAVRSLELLPGPAFDHIQSLEAIVLTVSMFGVGSGVSIARFRHVGRRALTLGVAGFVLVAGLALLGTLAVVASV